MPGSPNSTLLTVIYVGLLVIGLSACGGNKVKEDERRMGSSGDINRQINQGLGGRNREDGSLFGPGGLFGSKSTPKEDSGTGVAVNAYLWRASLETIDFMPLVQADPFGGVIITDWYSPPETPGERFKINVYILDTVLRADGVRVAVFRQINGTDAGWVDAAVDANTATAIEDNILTRARELRIAAINTQ